MRRSLTSIRHQQSTPFTSFNRDVPQEVVRVLLDHESHANDSALRQNHDQTVRRRWEAPPRSTSRASASRSTRTAARASRMGQDPLRHRHPDPAQRLLRAAAATVCPHANACLTCPVFLTGPEFLPELREQRHRTLTLIDVSRPTGTRMVEMNQQVLTNLERMIGEIENQRAGGDANVTG